MLKSNKIFCYFVATLGSYKLYSTLKPPATIIIYGMVHHLLSCMPCIPALKVLPS